MAVKRFSVTTLLVAAMLISLAFVGGCAKKTPGCQADEVKTLFRDGVIVPTIDQALTESQREIEQSAENQFLQPIYEKRHAVGVNRRSVVRDGFKLSHIKMVTYDQENDVYMCDANMELPGLDGKVFSRDISFKIYPVDKSNKYFEIEYGEWVVDFTKEMLFQPKIDLSF